MKSGKFCIKREDVHSLPGGKTDGFAAKNKNQESQLI
jgi:hypothetical protein